MLRMLACWHAPSTYFSGEAIQCHIPPRGHDQGRMRLHAHHTVGSCAGGHERKGGAPAAEVQGMHLMACAAYDRQASNVSCFSRLCFKLKLTQLHG